MRRTLTLFVALLTFGGLAFAQVADDTFVWIKFGNVNTLDPEGVYDTASGAVAENIYETLLGYVGDSITGLRGLLATDWTISDDGLTYTFNLREGVQFHSGNPFTCADVEYSIERILVMHDSQSGVWFQSEALLGTGSNANDDESITWAMIDNSVECLDDFTVQFNLPQIDPAFLVKLIYTNASIVDSAWAMANGEWDGTEATWREWVGRDPRGGYLHDQMSGTGPYRLVSWDGTDVVAEAFDGYWGNSPPFATS